ncbi:MAG: TonB-dependent receptor [Candidatus Hydrothermia bacterium]
MLVLLLSLELPLFQLNDTIVCFESMNSKLYDYWSPLHYSYARVQNSRTPFLSTLLFLNGQNISSPVLGGTPPEETLVMLDGIPMVNPMIGYQDVSAVPISIIGAIETLHSSSSLNALPGIGGTVNFIPKSTPFSLGWSNYRRSLHFTVNPIHSLSVLAFAEGFADSFRVSMDGQDIWITNTYDQKTGFLVKSSDGRSQLLIVKRECGAPSPLGSIGSGSRSEFLEGSNIQRNWKDVKVSISNYYTSQYYKTSSSTDIHKTLFLRNSYSTNYIETGLSLYAASSTKIGEKILPSIYVILTPPYFSFHKFGLSTNLSIDYNFNSNSLNPSLLFALSYKFRGNLLGFLNLSRNYRNPTFNELYWPEDTYSKGNPNLKPEHSKNIDLGIRNINEKHFISAAIFLKDIESGIMWVQESKYYPANFSNVVHLGADINFAIQLSSAAYWELSLNLQKSTVDGMPYLYRPYISANSYIKSGPVSFEIFYLGSREERPNSTKKLPPFLLLNGALEKEVNIKSFITIFRIGMENILNVNYELTRGYPQPGRELFIEINFKKEKINAR